MTLRRRLTAALAAVSLVLGGALVAAPAAAAPDAPAQSPSYAIRVADQPHAQPGSHFWFDLTIVRTDDNEIDTGRQISLTITFPDTVAFVLGTCSAYVLRASGKVTENPYGFVSGDECIVQGDASETSLDVRLEFRLPVAGTLPEPAPVGGAVGFEIARTLVLHEGHTDTSAEEDIRPPAEASGEFVADAPYLLSANPLEPVTWPSDTVDVKYWLKAPQIGDDATSIVDLTRASTTWDLTWPRAATLTDAAGTDFARCQAGSVANGYCRVTFTQLPPPPPPDDGPVINAVPSGVDSSPAQLDAAAAADTPSPSDDPVAVGCGAGYCDYVIILRFARAPDLEANVVTDDFTVQPVEGSYTRSGAPPRTMDPSWTEGRAAPHTFVERLIETSVTLSADSRPVGGDDIVATILVKQFDDADVITAYADTRPTLQVALAFGWPEFLIPAGDPQGCSWQAVQQVCVVSFPESPPSEATEITLTFHVTDSHPYTVDKGAVSVFAESVQLVVVGTYDGVIIDEAPPSVVVPSEAPLELYQPAFQTSVELSSTIGAPGGDDVVATFLVTHLDGSTLDFEPGSSVTIHLDWPRFLTLTGDPPCEGFLPDPAPDPTGGTCVLNDPGPPGWSKELTARFAMPTSIDAPVDGLVSIEGVSIAEVHACDCSTDVETDTYDSRYILPDSERFFVDTSVFPVDVVLDRTVSTPGGVRLYADVRVTYDHAIEADTSDLFLGIELDLPDFLTLVEPPGLGSCDQIVQDICYLSGLAQVGDVQDIELWFDMPGSGSGVGEIAAKGVRLCSGSIEDCSELPASWIGSDSETFTLLDPRIDVDLTIDRDTGWTGGKPVTATATVTHTGPIPGALPGLTVNLVMESSDFLTPVTIAGCDSIIAGVCRITGLDVVSTAKQVTLNLGMPPVEPASTDPSLYPRPGRIRVSGFSWSYTAEAPTPLPCTTPPMPAATAGPTPSPTATPIAPCEPPAPPPDTPTPSPPSFVPIEPFVPFSADAVPPTQEVRDLSTVSPEELVAALVGTGVTASNASYTGSEVGAGLFSGFDVIGFPDGVILSSGYADEAPGPNYSETTTGDLEAPGDADLEAEFNWDTRDASVLTFDFVPTSSLVTLDFVFASEEYSEYADLDSHGVFAIFVNGVNCALTPDDESEAVSVQTINGGSPLGTDARRPQLYRDNTPDPYDSSPTPSPLDLQADGLTTVLQCVAAVTPNDTNRMKIAIADTVSREWDSQIFLAARSLTSNRPPLAADQTLTTAHDTELEIALSASDADGDDLTYAVVVPPSHGVLTGAAPDLTYTPTPGYSGPDSFTFRARDGEDESPPATVTITVQPPDAPPPPPPPPADPVEVELPIEWIGSDFVDIIVLQPKVTIVPRVARPGEVVTVYVESLPKGASISMSWGPAPLPVPTSTLVLPAEVTFDSQRLLIVRRALLGLRDFTVSSTDGSFGDFHPALPALLVPRSTVADELVGRGG